MPNLKNLNLENTRVHKFSSAFAHHVGEDRLSGGRFSQFNRTNYTHTDTSYFDSSLLAEVRAIKQTNEQQSRITTKKHWWE